MLQETHWKSNSENFIRSGWGYNCFVAGNDTNKGGVAILFNNTFEYKMHNCIKSDNGNYIILDIELCNQRLSLVNVYGPSCNDENVFFEQFFDCISNVGNDKIIIGGDFNVPLNLQLDTRNYRSTGSRTRSRETILRFINELELVDVYRNIYPDKPTFTWRRFNSNVRSRLDYFLISESLLQDLTGADVVPGYRSDHDMVILCLKKDELKRRQYWKFNNSLLYDKDYVESIKQTILNDKKQYMLPVYNPNSIEQIPNEDIFFVIDDQLFLETLLMELRGKSISYASHKKKLECEREAKLKDEIVFLQNIGNLTDEQITLLENKKNELETIRNKKIQGMLIRSRQEWIHKGEKPTSYFCNLENRNFTAKCMTFLEKNDGTLIFDNDDIVLETKNFYEQLYAKRDVENVDLNNLSLNTNKLNDVEKEQLEGKLDYKEAHDALKNMKNNKSPGSDGFTTEFYKFFFTDIGIFLVRSLNHGFEVGKLSITQKQGVITCIPKEGKDKRYIKNWRPISLLNISYKIASSCIANRMKSFLHKLIHHDQKGFMSGRFLGENIRMIYDIITYAENEQIPGLLMLVDFEKAFDSISWVFIFNVLRYLNFGPSFIKWIEVFYFQSCSCISVNGRYSNWFNIERGVRQGDPLSPYLYLLCAEILSIMLRDNDRVKGMNINDKEFLLSQFADDTAICLDGSEEGFNATITLLSQFARMSGLKINFEKTIVTWIGSRKNCNTRYLRDKNFCWDPGIFTYLGVKFSLDIDTIPSLNYSNKLEEIKKILLVWKKRQLTPFGKITVLKTLAISKITHLFLTIPDPSDVFLNQLDKMFFQFLWDWKPSKIHRKIIFKSYENGGLNMLDVRLFLTTMKLSWIKRMFISHSSFQETTIAIHPILRNLDKVGSEKFNVIHSRIKNMFWKDVMKHCIKLDTRIKPTCIDEFNAEFIFHNKFILKDRRPFLYNDWIDNDVYQVYHLLDDQGHYLTYNDFVTKYPLIRSNFVQFNGVINSIKAFQHKLVLQQEIDYKQQRQIFWCYVFEGNKKIKQIFESYDFLAVNLAKWNNIFANIDWKIVFEKCHKTTIDCKLKWLQLRIIYRVIPTNRFLFIRKIKEDSVCEMCNTEEEDLKHMFYTCPFIKTFWDDLQTRLIQNCDNIINLQFSEELVFFGTKKFMYTDNVFDLIVLCAKYYIYSLKWSQTKPCINVFIGQLKQRYAIEKYVAASMNELHKFNMKWLPYLKLIQ